MKENLTHLDTLESEAIYIMREVAAECEKLEQEFAGEGRVLIRPSGTEPLVRVMIEGKDKAVLREKAEALAKLIEDILG